MPTRIAATAADTPPAYRRLNNYAQSWREGPARQAICGLPTAGDLGPTGPFNSLARHLHWLQRYHREQKPERYAPDIVDIRERDLPGVIAAVESWGRQILDAGLVEAI